MQPMFLNIALAFAAGFCATACRNDDALTLIDAPKDPTPAEKAQFQASKVNREETETPYGEPEPYQITANGATLVSTAREGGRWITRSDFRSLQPGMTTVSGRYILTNRGQSIPATIRSYQGFRSGVLVAYATARGEYVEIRPYGITMPQENFPTAGHATYRGTAFDMTEQGALTYHVDFAVKSGHGQIDGLSRHGTITLANAPIKVDSNLGKNSYAIVGKASSAKGSSFDYQVIFAGHQAEEIAGAAGNAQGEAVGFHGTRGAITE